MLIFLHWQGLVKSAAIAGNECTYNLPQVPQNHLSLLDIVLATPLNQDQAGTSPYARPLTSLFFRLWNPDGEKAKYHSAFSLLHVADHDLWLHVVYFSLDFWQELLKRYN